MKSTDINVYVLEIDYLDNLRRNNRNTTDNDTS
jgi:hypothetical protein